MRKKDVLTSSLYFSIFMFISSDVSANNINMQFSSLPSSQETWRFEKSSTGSHANDTESDTFSVDGSRLNVNTLGTGLDSPSGPGYNNYGVFNPDIAWSLSWTMKVLDYEQRSSDNNYAIFFGVYNGTSVVGLGLSNTEISASHMGSANGTGGSASGRFGNVIDLLFDTTDAFHTYMFSYTPDGTTGFGDWHLSIDGKQTLSGQSVASTSNNHLSIADGTGDANASWEMSAYTFNQESPTIVPIPATVWLFGTGLFCLIGLGRRKF